jgi:hypothetical protein
MDVWIAGAGMTRFGKRDETLLDLMTEAALAALTDASIERPSARRWRHESEEFTGEGNYGSLIGTYLGCPRCRRFVSRPRPPPASPRCTRASHRSPLACTDRCSWSAARR